MSMPRLGDDRPGRVLADAGDLRQPGHCGQHRGIRAGPGIGPGGPVGVVAPGDAANWKERATVTGHSSGVEAVAADGSWLASGGLDRTVWLGDVATGQATAFMRLGNNIQACAWLGSNSLGVGTQHACTFSISSQAPARPPPEIDRRGGVRM